MAFHFGAILEKDHFWRNPYDQRSIMGAGAVKGCSVLGGGFFVEALLQCSSNSATTALLVSAHTETGIASSYDIAVSFV